MKGNHTTENIIDSLAGVNGHTFDIVYNLFFTEERVIAVLIQHPSDIPLKFNSFWKTLFLGSAGDRRTSRIERERIAQARRETLQGLAPAEMVTSCPGSFEIPYREITSVEIAYRFFQPQVSFYVSGPSTGEQVIRFNLEKKLIPETRRILEKILPSKIRGQ